MTIGKAINNLIKGKYMPNSIDYMPNPLIVIQLLYLMIDFRFLSILYIASWWWASRPIACVDSGYEVVHIGIFTLSVPFESTYLSGEEAMIGLILIAKWVNNNCNKK